MVQLMPLPLTVSCSSKIQIGFTFLVPAHLGSPGKRAVKRECVCVRVCVCACVRACVSVCVISFSLLTLFLEQTHTHTHTLPFNGPFSGSTRVSCYQKGKTNLDFTEARDCERQSHQLGHMHVYTSLQTDNHSSTPPLSFFTGRMPFLPLNQQRQSTEGSYF